MIAYNPYSLQGKTILVVGASSGIGKACAEEAIKLGATVILVARRLEKLLELIPVDSDLQHRAISCDITENNQLTELIPQLPVIDGLVVTVGASDFVPLKFLKPDFIQSTFQTNVFSQISLFQQLLKSKKLQPSASCVLTASIAGNYSGSVGLSAYSASKSALIGFMRTAALELAPQKIRINAVCPGMVETDLIRKGKIDNEQYNKDIEDYPLKRYGTAKEIALGMIYLLSDASSWTTGTCLIIDGGFTLR